MNYGPSNLEAKPVLEHVCRALEDYLILRSELEHGEVERDLIGDSLRLAADFPDAARDIWEMMAAAVDEVNLKLRELKAPVLHFVSFETFVRLATQERFERPHPEATAASSAAEAKGD